MSRFQVTSENHVALSIMAEQANISLERFLHEAALVGVKLGNLALGHGTTHFKLLQESDVPEVYGYDDFDFAAPQPAHVVEPELAALKTSSPTELCDLPVDVDLEWQADEIARDLQVPSAEILAVGIDVLWQMRKAAEQQKGVAVLYGETSLVKLSLPSD